MVILLILQLCYLLPLDRRYWRTCIGIKDNEPERNICFISELLFFSPCFRSHTRDTGCFFLFSFLHYTLVFCCITSLLDYLCFQTCDMHRALLRGIWHFMIPNKDTTISLLQMNEYTLADDFSTSCFVDMKEQFSLMTMIRCLDTVLDMWDYCAFELLIPSRIELQGTSQTRICSTLVVALI